MRVKKFARSRYRSLMICHLRASRGVMIGCGKAMIGCSLNRDPGKFPPPRFFFFFLRGEASWLEFGSCGDKNGGGDNREFSVEKQGQLLYFGTGGGGQTVLF